MKTLASFVGGAWRRGTGSASVLVNPATEEPLAEASTAGVDFGAALAFARDRGGPALRALTFAERGQLLAALAKAIHGAREELLELAVANGGNTRSDAKFDVDGASATFAHYAQLGAELGAARVLADGEPVQVGRTARLAGQHVWVPRRGVAVHINAFNFPAWGLAEKAACALLAGVPVVSKPATATALVTHRLVEILAPLVPEGALSLICGGAGDLLDHLRPSDVLAFTGSSDTARMLRTHPTVLAHGVRLNVEADSLNAAVLAPDVDLGSETGQLFVADVVRDMTQKTGQKCTAIRRVLVPADRLADVTAALRDRLAGIVVGDPSRDDVRMGPVATAAQARDVKEGIARLAAVTDGVFGGTGEVTPLGIPAGKGFFVGPVLRSTPSAATCAPLHATRCSARCPPSAATAAAPRRRPTWSPSAAAAWSRRSTPTTATGWRPTCRRPRPGTAGSTWARARWRRSRRARAPPCPSSSTVAPAAPAAARSSAVSAASTSTCSGPRCRATPAC
jgi:3,4-dehydroadipyl-CoA semialdehyde dehydrogenase